MRKKEEINLVIEEEREMTDAEVETIAMILFEWFKRELEERETFTNNMSQ